MNTKQRQNGYRFSPWVSERTLSQHPLSVREEIQHIKSKILSTTMFLVLSFPGKLCKKILTQRNHTFLEGEHIVCDTNCEIERAFPTHLQVCSTYREKNPAHLKFNILSVVTASEWVCHCFNPEQILTVFPFRIVY